MIERNSALFYIHLKSTIHKIVSKLKLKVKSQMGLETIKFDNILEKYYSFALIHQISRCDANKKKNVCFRSILGEF